jgi:hypothetical protein
MNKNDRHLFLLLSIVTCIFIFFASYNGLTIIGFYGKETLNWQAQSIAQDMANLFLISPVLLTSAVLIALKKNVGLPLWAGTMLYLIYTYLIYCFNIHFNNYFIVYCLILGLCFYQLAYFMHSYMRVFAQMFHEKKTDKPIAIYFLILSLSFYFLWLMDIIPATLNNTVPKGVRDGGLFTNPVQVIDLSVFLPGVFITGMLLLNRNKLGRLFAAVLLMFFILMDLTIAVLAVVMVKEGVGSSILLSFIMSFLAVFSLMLLLYHLKKNTTT